jgi:hypothetical protein
MTMKLNKSQLVKVSKQLDGALEALDLLFQYEGGAKLMDDSKIDFSAIVGLKNRVDELAEKKSRKKQNNDENNKAEKISFWDLSRNKNWKEAVVVFTEATFKQPYTETERSYKISSGDKYFNGDMGGNSLYGDCLDGKDSGVRLDQYLYNGWKVDYCYITEYKKEGAHNNE